MLDIKKVNGLICVVTLGLINSYMTYSIIRLMVPNHLASI